MSQPIIVTTRQDVISRVDKLKINVYDNDTKLKYIDDLEGIISVQLHHKPYTPNQPLTALVIVPDPYTDMYVYYLFAMIDLLNMEYDSYNNNMVLFNSEWDKYKAHLSHFQLIDRKSLVTIRDLIDYTDTLRTNSFSDEVKLQMINEVEGIVFNKLLRPSDGSKEFVGATDYTKPLLIPDPFRDIYRHYLNAYMYQLENNPDMYQNHLFMYEQAYDEYAKYLKKVTPYKASKHKNVYL